MKKILLVIAVAALFAACTKTSTAEAPASDSTEVAVDTVSVDTLVVDSTVVAQ